MCLQRDICGVLWVCGSRETEREADQENVPKIVPLELGLGRTKPFKERSIGKEISGRGKRM